MAAQKPVLIAGAGLASLLFARSLLRSRIPFIIFERDQSIAFRAQGYRLRLSTEGLDAIEEVLGPEPNGFPKFWDRCGKTGGSKGFAGLNAVTGEELEESTGPSPPAPEPAKDAPKATPTQPGKEMLFSREGKTIGISRGDMRALFLEGCEDHVRWGHHVTGYESSPNGVWAIFRDGSKSEEGDLLVGGEGIYSKVAKQVSNGKLKTYDTGARGIHGQAPTTAFKALGEGVWRILDDTRSDGKVFAITNVRPDDMDDPDIQFGWTMGGQPGVIAPPNNDFSIIGKEAADIAKSLTANWHPRIKPLFDQMDEKNAAFWKITCSTPSGVPEWPNDPRVTVIGDAVHSMTPAGGIGANTAVRDSALLGRLLAEAGGWKEGITAAYEKEMRVYGSEAVAHSYGMAKGQFGVTIDEDTSPTVG
ncbi:FAD/NAD(P)-binding domain-containing protein [Pseudovirgaria hyperparasitica]|uniref:FAD/NAD(P)-binding domain-containing protein n=1 Tax=Pseudovirgaria hyperparasitica TaxID=470096 RepID=A0A6A6WBJ3_9PEZI|nr:FAD/NAD(P)-binding domain-containing protein [Pseudovirgaria hyperparasitica]KAF2759414.1 FAD/NAD(P)-binding domain-containing protein [Pseudovirgaria hyperparasitica]